MNSLLRSIMIWFALHQTDESYNGVNDAVTPAPARGVGRPKKTTMRTGQKGETGLYCHHRKLMSSLASYVPAL